APRDRRDHGGEVQRLRAKPPATFRRRVDLWPIELWMAPSMPRLAWRPIDTVSRDRGRRGVFFAKPVAEIPSAARSWEHPKLATTATAFHRSVDRAPLTRPVPACQRDQSLREQPS